MAAESVKPQERLAKLAGGVVVEKPEKTPAAPAGMPGGGDMDF